MEMARDQRAIAVSDITDVFGEPESQTPVRVTGVQERAERRGDAIYDVARSAEGSDTLLR